MIQPIRWKIFKTEAIDFKSDVYWIEDQPMAYEIEMLKKNKALDRWIKVDTRKEPDDLKRTLSMLKESVSLGSRESC